MADGFNHLDGYNPVVLAFEGSIILFQEGNAVVESQSVDSIDRVLILSAGYGGGCDQASILASRVGSKSAPTRTDLKNMESRLQVQLLANAVIFFRLRFFQGLIGASKKC